MKIVIVVVILILLALIYFLFFNSKALKASSQIDKIVIFYNEEKNDSKEFRLTEKKEIQELGNLLINLSLTRQPLYDINNMDDEKNWLINIYFNRNHRYLYVDKNINASLYEYLNENYRK